MGKLCDGCDNPSWTGQTIVAPELPMDGGGVKIVDELPDKGQKGMAYVLVDNIESPTKSSGIFVYDNGWLAADMPQNIQVVEELPDEGEPGYIYWVFKDDTDAYDLYQYINDEWRKIDVDIRLYSTTGSGIDGAMTQDATTKALAANRGLAKVLTTADYNWNSSTKNTTPPFDTVAIWLLDSGVYANDYNNPVQVAVDKNNYSTSYKGLFTVDAASESARAQFCHMSVQQTPAWHSVWKSSGVREGVKYLPSSINNLASTSVYDALSANQGRVLNEKVEGVADYTFQFDDSTQKYEGGMTITDVRQNGGKLVYMNVAESQTEINFGYGDAYIDLNLLSDRSNILTTLSYGNSTWYDFITAYNTGKLVYCRASSNANPASGSQSRMAFMAYVNNPTNPTEVEFQYVRSVSSKSASQQVDQVFVYKLTNASGGTWTVESRNMAATVAAGTNAERTYSNGTVTINPRLYSTTGQNTNGGVTQKLFTDTVGNIESILNTLNNGGA